MTTEDMSAEAGHVLQRHAAAVWGHLPMPVRHVLKSAAVGAGIGLLTGGAAATMKEVGLQQPSTGPGSAHRPSGDGWAARERHWHHHRHHRPSKGR